MIAALLLAATPLVLAAPPAPASPKPAIHAVIHPEAKDWKPVSLRAEGDPKKISTKAVLRQERVAGRYKGAVSQAKARIRLLKVGEDRRLVVSIFPEALEKRRAHFEIRFRLVENYVEEAQAVLVTVVDRHYIGWGLDADELRANGLEYEEVSPGSGQILAAALDPRPSPAALNAGVLKRAAFADWYVGLADVSWVAKGLVAQE